jgi:hypothetical protein
VPVRGSSLGAVGGMAAFASFDRLRMRESMHGIDNCRCRNEKDLILSLSKDAWRDCRQG